MSSGYDVIVIGARGSPTAMLLARKGYRVLLVDKTTLPSDTIPTHMIHPPGVAALKRWGLLESLEATVCPPINRHSFDSGRSRSLAAHGRSTAWRRGSAHAGSCSTTCWSRRRSPLAPSCARAAMDDFVSVMAGELGAPEFFAPDNVARIIGDAQAPAPGQLSRRTLRAWGRGGGHRNRTRTDA